MQSPILKDLMPTLMMYKTIMLSAASALLISMPAAATMSADLAYEVGLAAATDYRYSDALAQFRVAAQEGNRDAQRTLGMMLLYGEHLYGADVHRDGGEAIHWLKSAASSGCEVSTFMLKKLDLQGK
jgi:TPR repeat protein